MQAQVKIAGKIELEHTLALVMQCRFNGVTYENHDNR